MTMVVAQVRLPSGLVKQVDALVEQGMYANKSDAIRDAIRRFMLEKQVGSVPNTGDSVKEVREIRKILSKQPFDLDEINNEINKLR